MKQVWRSLSLLPEYKNWWSEVKDLMKLYNIALKEEEIASMSEGVYKKLIKEKVKCFALDELNKDVASKSKTRNLNYPAFETQKYLLTLPQKCAQTISRARSKTLEIKDHTPFLFKTKTCRVCESHDETLDHILTVHKNLTLQRRKPDLPVIIFLYYKKLLLKFMTSMIPYLMEQNNIMFKLPFTHVSSSFVVFLNLILYIIEIFSS